MVLLVSCAWQHAKIRAGSPIEQHVRDVPCKHRSATIVAPLPKLRKRVSDALVAERGGDRDECRCRHHEEHLLGLDGTRATLADESTITAARAYNADQVIYSISNDALLSPVAAYADKDVGPPLRDIALQAGPGFGVVAVAGLLAAEKIRGFRSRRQQGEAAAAAGIVVPSRWGPYARLLWDEPVSVEADQQLVDQAVALLLPILETTARRAWTAPDPEEEKPAFLSEKWAWQAMYEDGGSRSWSRGELTDLARGALGVAIASQRPPLAGDAWRITGQAVRSFGASAGFVLFCSVLFGLQLSVCLWWLQVPLRDLSDA